MHTFFIHIGKCGGMSIREMLKQKYGEQHSYDVPYIFMKWDKTKTKIPTAFYGHATYTLSTILPQPLYIFTMLRNPIDRVISYWKHMEREGPEIHKTNAHLLKMGFNEAIKHPDFMRLNNGMTKALSLDLSKEYEELYKKVYVQKMDFATEHNKISKHLNNSNVGIDRCYCDKQMYDIAAERLNSIRFGLQEHYEESIKYLFQPLGYMPNMIKTNAAPISQTFDITDEQLQILNETNKYDVKLYDYAQKLYMEKINGR